MSEERVTGQAGSPYIPSHRVKSISMKLAEEESGVQNWGWGVLSEAQTAQAPGLPHRKDVPLGV